MIKVMTMNINGYGIRQGAWISRIGLIREAIEDACPDIIALQAVSKDPGLFEGKDQATQLKELFKAYPYIYYHPAMKYSDDRTDGTAFISRFPLLDVSAKPLNLKPNLEDGNQRAVLHTRLDLKSGSLHIFNAYYSWVTEQAEENIHQTLELFKDYSGPALLVGDFNQPPDSPALDHFRQAGWMDLWSALYPSEDGFTFFESGQLVKRIDYAWANPELKDRVDGIRLVAGAEAALAERPSDHMGLLISLQLEAGEPQPCP